MRVVRVRRAEAKMRKTLLRVLGLVAVGSLPASAILVSACQSGTVDEETGDTTKCAIRETSFDAGDDAPANCERFFEQPCGVPSTVQGVLPAVNTGICQFNTNDCTALCGAPDYLTCLAVGAGCQDDGGVINLTQDSAAGPLIVQCGSCVGIAGRRPDGLDDFVDANSTNAVGTYFATCAYLEAASVHAFRILKRELIALGAPADLLDGASRAEADEVKHTRMTRKLARTHGGRPPTVRVKKNPNRSLEEIALENGVEGCVRETFGALLAMWQAEHASDASIATAMKEIAIDETRHAAFSWSVASWADASLDAAARARVASAREQAFADLEKEIAADVHPDLVDRAGMPTARDQKRLLREMKTSLSVFALAS